MPASLTAELAGAEAGVIFDRDFGLHMTGPAPPHGRGTRHAHYDFRRPSLSLLAGPGLSQLPVAKPWLRKHCSQLRGFLGVSIWQKSSWSWCSELCSVGVREDAGRLGTVDLVVELLVAPEKLRHPCETKVMFGSQVDRGEMVKQTCML